MAQFLHTVNKVWVNYLPFHFLFSPLKSRKPAEALMSQLCQDPVLKSFRMKLTNFFFFWKKKTFVGRSIQHLPSFLLLLKLSVLITMYRWRLSTQSYFSSSYQDVAVLSFFERKRKKKLGGFFQLKGLKSLERKCSRLLSFGPSKPGGEFVIGFSYTLRC